MNITLNLNPDESVSWLRYIVVLILALMAVGCASDYNLYAKAHSDAAAEQAKADTAKWNAMAAIAQSGSDTAKVAAVMAMALGGAPGQQALGSGLRAPESSGDNMLRWASVLVPSLTSLYMVNSTTRLGMRQSDNAATVATSTNNAFVGMAGKIQAPAANIATTTNTTNTSTITAGANSNLGAGAYTWSASDRHDVTTTTNTDDHTQNPYAIVPTAQIPAGKICFVNSSGTLVCQ